MVMFSKTYGVVLLVEVFVEEYESYFVKVEGYNGFGVGAYFFPVALCPARGVYSRCGEKGVVVAGLGCDVKCREEIRAGCVIYEFVCPGGQAFCHGIYGYCGFAAPGCHIFCRECGAYAYE